RRRGPRPRRGTNFGSRRLASLRASAVRALLQKRVVHLLRSRTPSALFNKATRSFPAPSRSTRGCVRRPHGFVQTSQAPVRSVWSVGRPRVSWRSVPVAAQECGGSSPDDARSWRGGRQASRLLLRGGARLHRHFVEIECAVPVVPARHGPNL